MNTTVLELLQDCKTLFSNNSNAPINKGNLIEQLQTKVHQYPGIQGTTYEVSVTNHFQKEAEHRLGIKLNNDDLNAIWR
ncbi:hypothetical protein [Niabella ginsengisoli]|uniref:Uncharacterized protein n=1 Tax=Niabella ginsengisoli TaxID=522298 RepID=A0ABS9SHU9_9BACT|nr:hypothetical protein [Niabella ginsengisoli]MCH5597943.1 hypothetical protein [Niabella ginsengisoli]